VSGTLLAIEVLADKVPWVDSLWDTVHTLIRPVGGALLAISALGTSRPEFDVVIALVAGGATMVSHGFKAGTRLMVNGSPEPASNFLVSSAEDVIVLGGLTLTYLEPRVAMALCVIFLLFAIYAMPKMFRRIKGFYWLLAKNLTGWMEETPKQLPTTLTSEEDVALVNAATGSAPEVVWALPVLTGRMKGMPKKISSYTMGKLVAVRGGQLYFVAKRFGGAVCLDLAVQQREVKVETRMFSESIVIYDRDPKTGKAHMIFRIPMSQSALARLAFDGIRQLQGRSPNSAPDFLEGGARQGA